MTDRHPRTALLLLVGLILLLNLGVGPVRGSEGRWGCIERAMLQTGDVFAPRIGNSLYWDKPLLSYWQALPFAALAGDATPFAIRLPSALWALLLLCLTLDMAKRWYDKHTALLAGLVLAGTWGFVDWGRNAQVEMTNAGVILLVLWLLIHTLEGGGTRWLVAAGIAAGVGANAKGLPAIIVPAICFLFLAISRRDGTWLRPVQGLLLASLACVLSFAVIPMVASMIAGNWDPLALMWRENIVRALAPFDHVEPWWTYLVRIFDLAAPWSLLLPLAVVLALKRPNNHLPRELVLGAGVLLVFTLCRSRRSYYLLPILPFVAILVGRLLSDLRLGKTSRRTAQMVRGFILLLGIGLMLPLPGLIAMHALKPDALRPFGYHQLLPALTALLVIGLVLATLGHRRAWLLSGWTFLLVWLVYAALIVPWMSQHSTSRADSKVLAADHRPYAFLTEEGARLLYRLDRDVSVVATFNEGWRWARAEHGLVLVPVDEPIDPECWSVAHSAKHWLALAPAGDVPPPLRSMLPEQTRRSDRCR